MSDTIQLTIQAAQAGGLAVFEYSHDMPSVLVFSGNLNETTEYLNSRMGEMLSVPATMPQQITKLPATFRKITPTNKLVDALNNGDM